MLGNFKEILLSDVEIIDGGNSNYLNGDIVNYQQILKVNKSLKVKNQKTASFKKIFEIKKGLAKYTKGFVQKNRGEYPLYSSQTINEGIIGKINCYDYDCECLTWATDGDAGAVFIRKGKFSMTTHCGALVLKSKLLLLEYIYSYLSENLKKYAVGGGKNRRITIDVIKNVKIKVPIALQGEFDLQKQREIAEKDKRVRELKNKVKLYKQKIDELVIEKSPDNSDNNFKEIAIDEIFDLATSRANSSKFTKSFIEKHKGDIPVYGASGNESVVGYGYVQDNLSGIKYFEDCLT
jgi:DNA-directed RNA polymerase beta' subunit